MIFFLLNVSRLIFTYIYKQILIEGLLCISPSFRQKLTTQTKIPLVRELVFLVWEIDNKNV